MIQQAVDGAIIDASEDSVVESAATCVSDGERNVSLSGETGCDTVDESISNAKTDPWDGFAKGVESENFSSVTTTVDEHDVPQASDVDLSLVPYDDSKSSSSSSSDIY